MKKVLFIILFTIPILFLTCQKRPELKIYNLIIKNEVVKKTATTVEITIEYSYPTKLEYVNAYVSLSNSFGNSMIYNAEIYDSIFVVTADNLNENTQYYYRFEYSNGVNIIKTETKNFTTESFNMPTVETAEVSEITSNSVKCGGNVISDGGTTVTTRGVCWSENENPTVNDFHTFDGNGVGSFTSTITGLTENTVYYVRAYATNNENTAYGEQRMFTTLQNIVSPTITTLDVTNITSTSATCGGNITSDGGSAITARGICWSENHEPTLSDSHTSDGEGTGVFTSQMTGLETNVTYYVRAYATSDYGTVYGEERGFITQDGLAIVSTNNVTYITSTSAVCGGNVTDDGGFDITERGVCWSANINPTINDAHTSDGSGMGEFTSSITGLNNNTMYYVRAFAKNAKGVSYGDEKSFTTSASLPSVTTKAVTNIAETSAMCGGNVIDNGGIEVTQRGVCWSTEHDPTTSDSHTSDGSGIGEFNSQLSGLTANTSYYVRAYAINAYGVAYGNEVEFTTQMGMPSVTTKSVTNITATSAQCGGTVINDGGGTVNSRGVCWGTSPNPTTSGAHTSDGTGVGEFTSSITGLTINTTYYVRAYAVNAHGTSYGETRIFTTQNGLAIITTNNVSNITANSATCGGNITYDGGFSITARGVCWSTSQNPTTNDSHTTNGSGIGSFTSNLTNLSYNTTYYVRAYATNSEGTSYGEEKTFTTNKLVPTVTTSDVSNITTVSAVCGGNVTSDGGASIIARGVCWSTSQNPTINSTHTFDGNGVGSYISNLNGLSENTTYYVRAYATNSEGTSYGAQKTFTTPHAITLPSVTTNNVTEVTSNSAVSGGNVTSAGYGTVSAKGICWSTSQNPTVSNSHTTNGSGTGSYISNITGLNENTTYYVRAYATNEAGTAYGEQKSFTTSHNISVPTVTTTAASNITTTTAVSGGNVTSAGYGTVTSRGVCWSTSHNPTTNNSHTSDGSGTGVYVSNLTNLTSNTTYYIRAFATNEAGTSYGNEVSFTTGQNIVVPTVSTNPVTNITQTTASCVGNVTADGGASVTERGVCWSTSHYPTINDTHIVNGSGTGSYTVDLTDLTVITTYYVRAYAINSAGVAYGNEVSFTTLANLPSVVTLPVEGVTSSAAVCIANVTNTGGASVTERGYCWSTSPGPTINGIHHNSGTGTGVYYTLLVDLSPNTVYYLCAYAINSAGIAYGNEVSFTTKPTQPEGAVDGIFSVSSTKQVYFSKGNLQYIGSASTPYWKFADHQWTYVGDNGQSLSNQTIDRDLFGWGTSGYNHGATCYQPWNTNPGYTNYQAYGSSSYHLYNQTGRAEWGYNRISNGGNTQFSWRTLKQEEWNYVLNGRTTSSGVRFVKAKVNGINGVILFPDSWGNSAFNLTNINQGDASYSSNIISATLWTNQFERLGAVFLPAAGYRAGSNGNTLYGIGTNGGYWSSECAAAAGANYSAYGVSFTDTSSNFTNISYWGKMTGYSVRLVKEL